MEEWETLLEGVPSPMTASYYKKLIQAAECIFKKDLALFELEWILKTLLEEPVNLLTIESCTLDDEWGKVLSDSFGLLTSLMQPEKLQSLEPYVDNIVNLCNQPLAVFPRRRALVTLRALAARSSAPTAHVDKYIAELNMMECNNCQCLTEIVQLIGTICEHYPEVVADDIQTIWLKCLYILQWPKLSLTRKKSVLEASLSILNHFGENLQTRQLDEYYGHLSACLDDYSCLEIVLRILSHHAVLFRPHVRSLLTRLRRISEVSPGWSSAFLSCFKAVCEELTAPEIQSLLRSEVLPYIGSSSTTVAVTMLRAACGAGGLCGGSGGVSGGAGRLADELRGGVVSKDTAEMIHWYVETNQPDYVKLLQTAIVFYDSIPQGKREAIIADSILQAKPDVKQSLLSFLITETCQTPEDPSALSRYLPLWTLLCQASTRHGGLLETLLETLQGVLSGLVEDYDDVEPHISPLSPLFRIVSHCIHSTEVMSSSSTAVCVSLSPLLTCCVRDPAGVCVAADVAEAAGCYDVFEDIRLDRCSNEALLCATCIALLRIPIVTDRRTLLIALKITVSRTDVEPTQLSSAIHKMEELLNLRETLDRTLVCDVIRGIEKLRSRKDMTDKHSRILRRDVLMFLGKYGNRFELEDNTTTENIIISKLTDTLNLKIPNIIEGTNCKINLQRILDLAVRNEDPAVLQTLLTVICANPTSPPLLAATSVVLRAACRVVSVGRHMRPARAQARSDILLKFLTMEPSPGVRRLLSALLLDHLTARDDRLAREMMTILQAGDPSTITAIPDIAETLIEGIKDNNSLLKEVMPKLLIILAKTPGIDSYVTFEMAAKTFIDILELFEKDVIDNLVRDILIAIVEAKDISKIELKGYRAMLKKNLEFIKNVYDIKKFDYKEILAVYYGIENSDFIKSVLFLGYLNEIFDLKHEIKINILCHNNYDVLNKVFDVKCFTSDLEVEAILNFLQEYAELMLETNYEKSISYVAHIIENLNPKYVVSNHRLINSSLSKYINILQSTPRSIEHSLRLWIGKIPIDNITNRIQSKDYTEEDTIFVKALKIMINTVSLKSKLDFFDSISQVKKWSKIILNTFANDTLKVDLKSNLFYLIDVLIVSFSVISKDDIKKLILEGSGLEGMSNENIGLEFCRFFMPAFYSFLVFEPFVLLEEDMKNCCVLIVDVVKYFLRRKRPKEDGETILKIIDQIWPVYSLKSTSSEKEALLTLLKTAGYDLNRESNPLKWVEDNMYICLLPKGGDYGAIYRNFAAGLSTKISEGGAKLRSILDAIAYNGDPTLIEIVINLIAVDETSDASAIISTVGGSIARLGGASVDVLYEMTICTDHDSVKPAHVLVTALRYSPPSLCLRFFVGHVTDLLQRAARSFGPDIRCGWRVAALTRAFTVLQVAFEKVPQSELELPDSVLNRCISGDVTTSWALCKQVAKLCLTRRKQDRLHCGATSQDQEAFRHYHTCLYTCLCAVLSRFPSPRLCSEVFSARAWDTIVDPHVEYLLPIRTEYNPRTREQLVSIVDSDPARSARSSHSARTAGFLRTLSENPLNFDLFVAPQEEVIEVQSVRIRDTGLNAHPCAAVLTALVRTNVPGVEPAVCDVMHSDANTNVKWLLAQVICNSKDETKSHAAKLVPALLSVVAKTSPPDTMLNGLHVEILETIIHWKDTDPLSVDSQTDLHYVTKCLVYTGLQKLSTAALNRVCNVLSSLFEIYDCIKLRWSDLSDYLLNPNEACFKMFLRISKHVLMPELIESILTYMTTAKPENLKDVGELFGLVLVKCPREVVDGSVQRYRALLQRVRNDVSDNSCISNYIKMLHHVQSTYPEICDRLNFRTIADQVSKVTGRDQINCLNILSTYISNNKHMCETCDKGPEYGKEPEYDQEPEFGQGHELANKHEYKKTHACDKELVCDAIQTVEESELIERLHWAKGGKQAATLLVKGAKALPEGAKRRVINKISVFCHNTDPTVRKDAYLLLLEAAGEYLKPKSPRISHAEKRPRLPTRSPIVDLLGNTDVFINNLFGNIGAGLNDIDPSDLVKALQDYLCSSDMSVRFAESFILCIYFPLTYSRKMSSQGIRSLLYLFLHTFRNDDRFKGMKLRDEPLPTPIREPSTAMTRLLTNVRTYQGTFRTNHSGLSIGFQHAAQQRKPTVTEAFSEPMDDVMMSIDSILHNLLNFGQLVPEALQALCVEFCTSLATSPDKGFGFKRTMSRQIAECLMQAGGEMTPFLVELYRVFIDNATHGDGFPESIAKLRESTKNTEGGDLINVLYEDIYIRTKGYSQIVLGTPDPDNDNYDVDMSHNPDFNMEDFKQIFGKLSNWDDIRSQDKRQIQRDLPRLWTTHGDDSVTTHTDELTWLGKLVSAYKGVNIQTSHRWLRQTDRWPANAFHVAAVVEALQVISTRQSDMGQLKLSCEVNKRDCLAEWAARLMVRAKYVPQLSQEENAGLLSRSNELAWCVSAIERGLPALALQCIERNRPEWNYESELQAWLPQYLIAKRQIAIGDNDNDALLKVLEKGEQLWMKTSGTPQDVLTTNRVILMLRHDLGVLTPELLEESMKEIDIQKRRTDIPEFNINNSKEIKASYTFSITYYDVLYDTCDKSNQYNILNQMCEMLKRSIDHGSMDQGFGRGMVDLLLCRLDGGDLPKTLSENVNETIKLLLPSLSPVQIDYTHSLHSVATHVPVLEIKTSIYKRCLQLVCDTKWVLLNYCATLMEALAKKDSVEWKKRFDLMKSKIFENPYAGSDYQRLYSRKEKLYTIYKYESSDVFLKNATDILKDVMSYVGQSSADTLSLSQLCPDLANKDYYGDRCMSDLLGLPNGEFVVKFNDELRVMRDSIRHPVLLTALTSRGTTRQFIVKTGETLRIDRACLSVKLGRNVTYNVTPLCEDSGLIECLPDHTRVRDMVENAYKAELPARTGHNWILGSMENALAKYNDMCEQVPAYLLRSEIERNSCNMEDFFMKKRRFTDTLASMTIVTWLLGVGDRHLNNILVSPTAALVSVDWGDALTYVNEPTVARLGRVVRAVANHTVLESRLQSILSELRESRRIVLAGIKVAFHWMGDDFYDKLPYIKQMLEGTNLSYHTSRQIYENSNVRYKEIYIELLDKVFKDVKKNTVPVQCYSVEEQISSLLIHCTDPRILAVIRNEWEPWI